MPSDFAEIQAEAARRWQSLTAADRPWLRVGTALCGQAAGAEETAAALETALRQRGIAAPVSRVGCLGLCFAEPLVDVLLPGQPRIFYDRVTPELAAEIVEAHIVQGRPLSDRVLGCLYPETAAAGADADTVAADGGNGSLPDLNRHPMRAREQRIALRNAGHIDPLDIYQYIANGGYRALHQAVTGLWIPPRGSGTGQCFRPARPRRGRLSRRDQVAIPGRFQRPGQIYPLQLRGGRSGGF